MIVLTVLAADHGATSPTAGSVQMTETTSLPVSDEVVERLLHTLAQRIDRGPTNISQSRGADSAPPEYHARS